MRICRGMIYHTQYGPERHHRRSIRLKGFDYSKAGAYFVTICTHLKRRLLGHIKDGQILLTTYGHIARSHWSKIPEHFQDIELDEFTIMPNHIHGILFLNVGARFIVPIQSGFDKSNPYIENNPMISNQTTLGKIIRFFKVRTTHQNRNLTNPPLFKWQRNYYEHVIRNENELDLIREYIQINPLKWQFDRENPDRIEDRLYQDQWKWLERGYT